MGNQGLTDEFAVAPLIRVAIREKRLLDFVLHRLRRIAEPHVYGIRRGVPQLLVYQTAGQSKSGRLPNWRTADLKDISHLRVLDQRFAGPRLPPDRHDGWDQILAQVD